MVFYLVKQHLFDVIVIVLYVVMASQHLISYFLLADIGALALSLLWNVALSTTITAMLGALGSNCFVNHHSM